MAAEASGLNEAVEQGDVTEPATVGMPADSSTEDAAPAAAPEDAADILAVIDDLEAGQAPTPDPTPNNAPLTAEEHARMAELLGDPKPPYNSKPRAQSYDPPPAPAAEMTQHHDPSLLAETEICQPSTLGREIDDLLTNIQTQIEAVVAEHDLLSKKLTLAKARVRELERGRPSSPGSALTQAEGNEKAEHLRTEIAELSQRQEALAGQLQRLLGPFETANMAPAEPGADLRQARETLGNLQKKLSSRAETFLNDDAWNISAPAQPMQPTAAPAIAPEPALYHSANQQEAVRILREIQSRLKPLPELGL